MTAERVVMAPTHNLNSALHNIHNTLHMQQSSDLKMEQTAAAGIENRSNTLQSVLQGEIPSAYIHLTNTLRTNMHSSRQEFNVLERDSPRLHIHTHKSHENSFRPYPCNSPLRNALTSSPKTHMMARSPKRNVSPFVDKQYGTSAVHQEHVHHLGPVYERGSPAYEGRSSPYQDSGSPFIGNSPYYDAGSSSRSISPSDAGSPYPSQHNDGSMYSPHRTASPYSPHDPIGSPYTHYENSNSPYSGSRYVDGSYQPHHRSQGYSVTVNQTTDQPIDLSCKPDGKKPTNTLVDEIQDGSLLRHLLLPGKIGNIECIPESGRDSPGSDVYKPDIPVTGSTRVTLAKKMVYPITSRVSDWLVKIVQFSKSIPEFQSMSPNDKITLILHSWTRTLLLLMAENDYEFAVTPLYSDIRQTGGNTPSQDEPTMKSVEGIQNFIRKCKNMYMDQKEYALLRMAVLFNSGNVNLDDPELVEKLNSAVQQLLHQHVTTMRPDDVMHYSKILMLLPSLYGINCRMVENLFCKRINTDMQVLLKEMLQNL